MNIKGLIGNIPATSVRPTERIERTIKSDSTNDRDANGQQTFDQKEKDQSPMSEEQLLQAIAHLRNLPFVKEHNWSIELLQDNDKKFVIVKDLTGIMIRKIPENELWTLPLDFNDLKGQLLRKTA